ncbi:MAG: DNA photolyase family protein [Thermoanaerobaculia bacterium]|nr:DNA photolyase family protein [Thermoanaerobaculia bacterium]
MADNPALDAAVSQFPGAVTALFVETPKQWTQHDWGPPKIDFVKRSVLALEQRLAECGIALRREVVPDFEAVPGCVMRIVMETASNVVYVNRELEVNERRRDRAVLRVLNQDSIGFCEHDDQTILPPGSIGTKTGDPYSVFSAFFRSWARELEARGFDLPLPVPSVQGDGPIPWDSPASGAKPGRLDSLWPAGEVAAETRLEDFLATSARYYHQRRDEPSLEATSSLSPYLAAGVLSVRTLLHRGLEASDGELVHGDPGLTTWLKQLAWRDFYRHVVVAFSRVSMNRPFKLATERIEWNEDPEGLEAWKRGQTGFPLIDAAMRSLAAQGWMHNRLRMVVASFLAKDLLLDWRLGEQFFMQNLVDADLANNNGGWQWAASTGTDAVPYFRIFSPWRQSQRFDAEGLFIHRWVPELREVPAPALHNPKRLAKVRPDSYPSPIVDHRAARQRAIEAFKG